MLLKFRYDYFLIWGHGILFRDQILDMIRSHAALRIIKIMNHVPETVEQLIHAVYSFDYAPFEHLIGKTEYLKKTPNEVYFVFVENHFPDEDYFGDGLYRHIESKIIKTLKEQIRDLFNPRVAGTRSEDHVIHASDNQLQTDHILRYLGYQGVDWFTNRQLALHAPYHMRGNYGYTIRNIQISALLYSIVEGNRLSFTPRVISIEETPHYRALSGNCRVYEEYVSKFLGRALTDDHSLHTLLELKRSFRYLSPPFESDFIIVLETGEDRFVVLDGVHRAATLKYQGALNVHVAVIHTGSDNARPSEFF